MAPLQKLWSALEEIPGGQAARAEWRDRLGADVTSLELLLRPTDQFAATLPVASDPYALYRVVWHAPDDIVGVHESGDSTIKLAKRDVLIYRLDHQCIIRNLAAALGFEHAHAITDGSPHTYQIGNFRPFAGFSFPAFLTFPLESIDLQHAVESVSSQQTEPFVIVAPTRRQVKPACEVLLKQHRACFLALSESIQADEIDKWAATTVAKQQLSAFQQAVIPQAAESSTMVFFPTPANAKWTDLRVKFIDGHTISVKIGSASGTYMYSQVGMADGRNAKPTKQWDTLRSFARTYGVLTWDHPDADRRNQKRRENLARDLKAFFRIDGEPIEYVEQTKGWRTVFNLEPDA